MAEPATILLVDWDESAQEVTTFLLQEAGYTVLQAFNGSEAIAIVKKQGVDLVLMEMELRDMKGTELCRILKEQYFADIFVPVIMLTGHAHLSDRVTGLQIGADDYLVKPFEPSELMARIEAMLRIRSMIRISFQSKERRVIEEIEESGRRLQGELQEELRKLLEVDIGHYEHRVVELRFNFPPTVKVACEQYLLYFVEFLHDVGIEADANLREDARGVLFSITPKDKNEALDNIWEALSCYLELPKRQVAMTAVAETSIEVQRLGSQVLHFQSQVMLGNALVQQQQLALQQKDTIIEQQQRVIDQQHLTSQVLLQSLQREAEEDEAEPVAGKLVRVKRWNPENIPVDIDLPEVIRYLKEKFRRKKLQ